MKEIKKYLKEIKHVENISTKTTKKEGSDVIAFTIRVKDKKNLNVFLFNTIGDNNNFNQLFSTLPQPYINPEQDLYEIINHINQSSILGFISLVKSDIGDYHQIAYKSNFISKDINDNFKIFLENSIYMLTKLYNEIEQ